MNTTLYQNLPEDRQNWTNLYLEPHDYRIYYVNIDLRHQYGISVAEWQTFLRAKRPQRRRARRSGCFRWLCFRQWSTIFLRCFMIFLILVFCKNKAMSASCPQQKFHSSTRFRSLFLSSLGSFSILFLRAKLGECVALWFALTPPQLKWLTEQKNPFVVCKHAARYNEFGYKTSVARIAKVVWGRRLYCIFRKSAAVLCIPT